MSSLSPKDPHLAPTELPSAFLPTYVLNSLKIPGPGATYVCSLLKVPLIMVSTHTTNRQVGRKAPSKLWGWHVGPHRIPTHILPASSPGVAKTMLTRQSKLSSSFSHKSPTPGTKGHQFILFFHMHTSLLDHSQSHNSGPPPSCWSPSPSWLINCNAVVIVDSPL